MSDWNRNTDPPESGSVQTDDVFRYFVVVCVLGLLVAAFFAAARFVLYLESIGHGIFGAIFALVFVALSVGVAMSIKPLK